MKILNYAVLISYSLWMMSIVALQWQQNNLYFQTTNWEITSEASIKVNTKKEDKLVLSGGTIREVTAYNVGDPRQTDNSPCIGASGDDICKLLKQGQKICAANFVKLGSFLFIKGYGRCQVLDRMAKKNNGKVDIAMPKENIKEAMKFGRQKLLVIPK